MTTLTFAEAAQVIPSIKDQVEKLKPPPVFFYPYLSRVLKEQWDKLQPQFPMEIRIAKENKYLLKGDFEPEAVVTLEEPLRREDGTPYWFENTASEAWLRFGYDNLDARYICSQKLDMEFIRATCSTISLLTKGSMV